MRIIEGRLWNAPVADVYHKYEILTVNNLYRFEVAKFMYLYHCNQLPSPLSRIFSYFSCQSEHFTRGASAGSMQLLLFRTVKLQRSFIVSFFVTPL